MVLSIFLFLHAGLHQAEAAATSIELEAKAKAEAVRIQGLAEAEIIRAKGAAEIEIVKAKGEAEANVMKEKAQAFRLYNDAAMAQMIVDRMPEIAQAIAAPLAKTEKIVIVDNGSTNGEGARGASKVTNYVTDIIGQLPETVEALTGYNLMDVFKKKGQSAQTPAADTVEAAQEAEPAE